MAQLSNKEQAELFINFAKSSNEELISKGLKFNMQLINTTII